MAAFEVQKMSVGTDPSGLSLAASDPVLGNQMGNVINFAAAAPVLAVAAPAQSPSGMA